MEVYANERIREECGIFGVYQHPDACSLTCLGLLSLQHRGEESCGIYAHNEGKYIIHKGIGSVDEVLSRFQSPGNQAIGHVRYSTSGGITECNAQPLLYQDNLHRIAICTNGHISNAESLRALLEADGISFHTANDAEVILQLLALAITNYPLVPVIKSAISKLEGAFALLIMFDDKLIAVQDPHGYRPLMLGIKDGSYILASETCALDTIGAHLLEQLKPGQIILFDGGEMVRDELELKFPRRLCSLEFIYFSRTDSYLDGLRLHILRMELGKKLSQVAGAKADLVVAIPESGIPAAMGYAQHAGIPYEAAIFQSRYMGRTFIQPNESVRDAKASMKYRVISEMVHNRRVVVVDDSLVRGTTCSHVVRLLKAAGASEIHIRISSPPFLSGCSCGIDIQSLKELPLASMTTDELCVSLGADSLVFLSSQQFIQVIVDGKHAEPEVCTQCFQAAGKPLPERSFSSPVALEAT
jgi:amidophosphoribosyltransferase